MEQPKVSPEHRWASQLTTRPDRLPVVEPHYTKKDDVLIQYLMDRCIDLEIKKEETTGELIQVPKVIYQNILDSIMLGLSHLISVSNLDDAHAVVQNGKWNLQREIMEVEYEALEDQEALHLIGALDATVYNIIWGRAHKGTHQHYDATVAGAHRSLTVEEKTQRGGLFNRGR